ncbi:MAG: FAD:protein FMN transferase [Bacteroidaceae bacterium]|nr:FAD:protein FMN transferase [Bacteroidaceae bacterium]
MKKWHYPFLLLLIVGTVIILGRNRKEQDTYYTDSGFVFGTTYNITYRYSRDIEDDIKAAMLLVDGALSMFNDTSTISRINRNEDIVVTGDTMFIKVFRRAMEISSLTHGAFDVTVAPAVNAWGFGFKNSSHITDSVIDSLLQLTGYTKIREEDGRIVKDDPRIMLDCSAIAKGYGCDVVADVLRGKGIGDFLVEIGGEMVISGLNPKGGIWNIGVSQPDDDLTASSKQLNTILHLTDCAMATSGNYRNFYEKDGIKYAHTIDPHTCRPVSHSLLSATVVAQDCATADALATSFMVMGADSAVSLVKRMPEIQAYLLVATEDGIEPIDLLTVGR